MSVELEAHIRRCAEQVVIAARSDPAAAAELVRQMEELAGQDRNPLFEAFSQRANGHLHQIRGSMPNAVQRYRQALVLFEDCRDHVEWARTASSLVGALVPLGQFEEALRLAEQARQIFQQANLQIRAARLDVNVGNLYHRLNRLEEALLHYERAAELLEKSDDREAAAGVLINRSVMLMLLYRFDDAFRGFVSARAFSEERGLTVFAMQSEYNRAYLHFLVGDFAQSLRLMQIAEAGFQELGDEIHVAHCRLDRGEILLELNLPEHALDLAGLAERGFRSSGLNGDRSRALLLIGRALMRLGQTGEAVTHYKKARRLFQSEGNDIWAAMADLEIAAALGNSGEEVAAAELAERTGELFRSRSHYPFSALSDALSARLSIAQKNADGALFFLKRCEESLRFQPPACLRYHMEYLKGRAHELQGNLPKARASFLAASESLEFLLAHISVDHALVRFLEDKDDVYERLAGLSDDVNEMFQFVDRARTRALTTADCFRESSIASSGKARSLRDSLRADYLRLFQANQPRPDVLFEKIQQGEQQLMQELLGADFSRAEPAKSTSTSETVQLTDEEVLVEYFIQDDRVSAFVLGKDRLDHINLPIATSELYEEVHFARYGLSRPRDSRYETALRHHLHRLYDTLIDPLKPLLRRRVVFVPHRLLNHLPFHALLGPKCYAAEEYIISYAPSMAAYARATRKQSSPSFSSLILGAESQDLPAVPGEVREVARRLPNCRIAVNESLAEVRHALETAAFIHIATHGVFRADNPTWSLLNLGSDVLTPTDVLNLRVNADLVTMSSCSTGQSYVRGTAVQGFVRAFSQWGAPSLIGSLWEVNDEATSLLMGTFYERLQATADIADSLREAMLEVKKTFAHPYYWAAFLLIGRQKLSRSWSDREAALAK